MKEEQKFYIYGVVQKNNFTQNSIEIKGLCGENIQTEEIKQFVFITSKYADEEEIPVLNSRQNMVTHQKIIEFFFEKHTIIPTQFGTLMNKEEMKKFIENNLVFLNNLFEEFEGKSEMVLKGFWMDMPAIFKDIAENTPKINSYREKIRNGQIPSSQNNLVEIGKMVEEELISKKKALENFFDNELSNTTHKIIKNPLLNEAMCINMAFLIDRKNETIFDEKIQKLTDKLDKEIKFQFFGAAAPAHFIKIETD